MNEASVSTPFMDQLRSRLPEAEIVKTHDASTVGLPDCSITYLGREFKLEFKLWVPLKSWNGFATSVPAEIIARKQPQQLEMMKRYSRRATFAFYLVWVKKLKCLTLWDPCDFSMPFAVASSTPDMVEGVADLIEKACR